MKKVAIAQKSTAKINTGGLTVGATVVALSTNTRALEGGVQIVADSSNGNIVYVGVKENLTAGTSDDLDGFPLAANQSIFLPVSNEAEVRLIAGAASQGIHFASF